MSGFDPYLVWLDIPPHERPATYYRLLGLRPLESDPQVISGSAQRVIAHVARFQQSEHAAACTQLLSELAAARDCLLHPQRKLAYDSGISQSVSNSCLESVGRAACFGGTTVGWSCQSAPCGSNAVGGTTAAPGSASSNRRRSGRSLSRLLFHNRLPRRRFQLPQFQPPLSPLGPKDRSRPQPGETPVGAPTGVPQSVQPAAQQTPYPQTAQPTAPTPPHTPPAEQPQPETPQPTPPPAWATGERTGEVSKVVAGQPSPPSLDSGKTRKGRQLRRAQQTQSAYMLVGIAMALIVFFFGAVLLIAIFLGGQ